MKILYIIDSLASGGKERQLVELLKGLAQRKDIRYQLVVLSVNIDSSYVKGLNINMHCLQRRRKRDPGIYLKLYKICKEFQPDIIHSWEAMCSLYALPVARFLGIRFMNGIIRNAPVKLKPFSKAWLRTRLTFPFSNIVLGNSSTGLNAYKAPMHKSYCIRNGFDISRIENLEESELIRTKFNIRTENIVGMVGRFHAKKDYGTYISSAVRILNVRKDVTFLAIGDGETLEEYSKAVAPQFQDKVKFLGRQNDIESIINIFDVGVLATYAEGISNAIMEYMALGKPVVAARCGGTAEIVLDKKTGFLVEPENAEAMAEKIQFLLDNRDVAKVMGNEGKERILSEFSLKEMTDRHVRLYEKCLKGRS